MKMAKHKIGRWAGNFFPEMELRRRELGLPTGLGWEAKLKHSLYSSLKPSSMWASNSENTLSRRNDYGGIYNLEFSEDGRKLVAACEHQAVLLFDPITRKQVAVVDNAHTDCVNCIKFLDNRLFASCSDDKTVAIWDVRNLSSKVSILKGHKNWVKNIEYSSNDGLLVTSAFDGRILGWDISTSTENSTKEIEILNVEGLMRTRLVPGGNKMVICTSRGFLILVHNLSLFNLFKDNEANMCLKSNDFNPKDRNRMEIISDFPDNNEAEMVHSLQVHPHGWCALSRNTSSANASEWTCVHDIQDLVEKVKTPLQPSLSSRRQRPPLYPTPFPEAIAIDPDTGAQVVHWNESPIRFMDPPYYGPPVLPQYENRLTYRIAPNEYYVRRRRLGSTSAIEVGPPRLTNYIEEMNRGPGFIKELCFNSDGRLICSPYDTGVRLMMFDNECSELSHCVQNKPQVLKTIAISGCHTSCVVSTKFSPIDCLLVSGSLGGELIWHQPVL